MQPTLPLTGLTVPDSCLTAVKSVSPTGARQGPDRGPTGARQDPTTPDSPGRPDSRGSSGGADI